MENRFAHIFWILFLPLSGLLAQEDQALADSLSRVFELGEVQVVGKKSHPFTLVLGADALAGNPKREMFHKL